MEWLCKGTKMYSDEEPGGESSSTSRSFSCIYPNQQPSSPQCAMESLCQSQQRRVKASIVSNWGLAEAQDQLSSLGVHSSESLEQERARTLACPSELTHTEEEWRRKESLLGRQEPSSSPVLGASGSWDVFDKSIINVQSQAAEMDQDKRSTFAQKYEKELRHFGMLRRWNDSQRFLADLPQLICEETAHFLILWCMRLQQDGKEALMEQVAHQAVVMQFILEMASNSQRDPRECFRQFFHKAKDGQDLYLEVFHTELEAFKHRVKEYTVHSRGESVRCVEQQSADTNYRLDPKEASLLPAAGYPTQRCTSTRRWTKDDVTETDDMRMMETS
ncbi:hsp90 co-chaperone Cdc37-like 1 [Brachionichthys hirsutus]|uniref:hsp90 co-chaperone Cdc37-like 1 n=1 Tax=Brachionichthys hirsutus TaxID=412623 RepID=UPI0036047C7C